MPFITNSILQALKPRPNANTNPVGFPFCPKLSVLFWFGLDSCLVQAASTDWTRGYLGRPWGTAHTAR